MADNWQKSLLCRACTRRPPRPRAGESLYAVLWWAPSAAALRAHPRVMCVLIWVGVLRLLLFFYAQVLALAGLFILWHGKCASPAVARALRGG
jgi:hypothetical protein